ncbi:unnamed protein product [Didymodactylos carnosus]|uniref:Apple domain-containing protein n=1 Tax=Didymodactylos carnosus TaxID=1234261 RepID=A0A814YLW7_9BILA|nr:unnamed protein product [Didymodactylos carnosus]CAF3993320.1 unnamed protein product [Didymodactylos carnosus]
MSSTVATSTVMTSNEFCVLSFKVQQVIAVRELKLLPALYQTRVPRRPVQPRIPRRSLQPRTPRRSLQSRTPRRSLQPRKPRRSLRIPRRSLRVPRRSLQPRTPRRPGIFKTDFGTSFTPADPIELINTISVSSQIRCAQTCNVNSLCRTFDYDTLSKRCRLFEGEITTGLVNRSAAIPSTSRVGSIAYTPQIYLAYNRTCDQCQINRYLLCISNTCQCTPYTYWNGYMCLNQGYNGSVCQNDQWCRNDKNLTCSSSDFCEFHRNISLELESNRSVIKMMVDFPFGEKIKSNHIRKASGSFLFRSFLKILFITFGVNLIFQFALHMRLRQENMVKKIDNSLRYNATRTIEQKEILNKSKFENKDGKKKCSKITHPKDIDLDYNNIYWQRFISSNGTYYLYHAFYDNRVLVGSSPLIRILSVIDRISPIPIYCLIWLHNTSSSIITSATYQYIWHPKWGNYRDEVLQPFLIITLFETNCTKLGNNLPIRNNRPLDGKKQPFAVCVKGLEFLSEDISVKLIEWIELLNLLGAEKIFFYEFDIHPNISQVLEYYQQQDKVHVEKLTLPGSQPNSPEIREKYLKEKMINRRQNELIPYNDCFYKNIYFYHYILLLDIDEVIMPLQHRTWLETIQEIQRNWLNKNETYTSFSARNVYFLEDLDEENSTEIGQFNEQLNIPPYLHMLTHIYRSSHYTISGAYVKTFFDTERLITLHNHFPLSCFRRCRAYEINITLAHLQHYRKSCVKAIQKSCQTEHRLHRIRDTTIWRYKNDLIQRTSLTLKKLNFLI